MPRCLMIPIRLDALIVGEQGLTVMSAGADFSRLPFLDRIRNREINRLVPNISEAILSQPFRETGLGLDAGIHLHWAMPDALTHGQSQLDFPVLPNRWLVTREALDGGCWEVSRQWVVESDYLHPPDAKGMGSVACVPYLSVNWEKSQNGYAYNPGGFVYERASLPESLRGNAALLRLFFDNPAEDSLRLITIQEHSTQKLTEDYLRLPLSDEQRWAFERFLRHPVGRSDQPFRHMGRRLPLSQWKAESASDEYYPDLTAVGYGDPVFAAFYPNCRSVFGMRDELDGWEKDSLSSLRYKLIGWYGDPAKDAIHRFIAANGQEADGTAAELAAKILEKLKWNVFPTGSEVPDRLLCYAELSFDAHSPAEGAKTDAPEVFAGAATVTVANTPTEAFAACLARKLSERSGDPIQNKGQERVRDKIEDQLEAMQYAHRLKGRKLDMRSHHEQIRHENGFTTVDGGSLWVIRKETRPGGPAEKTTGGEDPPGSAELEDGADLPSGIAAGLDTLNRMQGEYDAARREIEGMRRQLFADWYKYMICLYPTESTGYDYPDPDLVRHFIETKILAPLEDTLSMTGEVEFPDDGILPRLVEPPGQRNSGPVGGRLADRLVAGVAGLKAQIEEAETQIQREAREKSLRYSLGEAILCELEGQISESALARLRDRSSRLVRQRKADFIDALVETLGQETVEALAARLLSDAVESRHAVTRFHLERIPAPRFWQPTHPVVLIEGDVATPTRRHGQDGVLGVDVFDSPEPLFSVNGFNAILDRIDELRLARGHDATRGDCSGEGFAFNTWKNQPWNPIMLEWQVSFFPSADGANLTADSGLYRPTYIVDNYALEAPHPDLVMRRDKAQIADSGCIYSGTSILTPHASDAIREAIVEELVGRLRRFPNETELSARADAMGESEIEAIGASSFDNPADTLLLAYQTLRRLKCLSQTLNGFNNALLMQKQTLALAVQDPLGFESYRAFTDGRVHGALEAAIKTAPTPAYAFTPIRSGCLKLLRLRLVDSFGRTQELKTDVVHTTSAMRVPASRYLVRLAPRLVQPARLNFRWLDGENGERVSNAHVSTTPVCGWLLINRLDVSLMFYDASGKALGYFQHGERGWQNAIDSDCAVPLDDIRNEHLRKIAGFVKKGMETHGAFLGLFIDTIDDALKRIHPEKDPGSLSTALLMGRPVAVVRATLDLETSCAPAINQSWTCFRHDLNGQERMDDLFPQVEFPVRLGEAGLLSDGLVGYWIEEKQGHLELCPRRATRRARRAEKERALPGLLTARRFISPENAVLAGLEEKPLLEGFEDGAHNFTQSISGLPQNVTMLMDVEGSIRATMGIVPCKEICIPPEQYASALQAIEMTFRHAPILTGESKVTLPLRPLPRHVWSWVEPVGKGGNLGWKAYFPGKRMARDVFKAQWEALNTGISAEKLWAYLLLRDVAWLAPIEGSASTGEAWVVDSKNRKASAFDRILVGDGIHDIRGRESAVEGILEAFSFGIVPGSTDGVFTGKQVIREGWLKLRQDPEQ